VPAQARAAGARYARQWAERDPEAPEYAGELDEARTEWGLTIAQLFAFFYEQQARRDVRFETRSVLTRASEARGASVHARRGKRSRAPLHF
jgi:hypothetical protein